MTVMYDRVLQGGNSLIRARGTRFHTLDVHRLCACGICVTEENLRNPNILLVIAVQMILSDRIPTTFFTIVRKQEKEVFRINKMAEEAEHVKEKYTN